MGVGSASVVDYANTYPGTASHVNATGSVGDFEVVVDGSGATTLSLNFQTATTLDPRITFTRASSATQYNSVGTLISVGSDVARFDYDPATLAPKGLLIEEQRTNLLTYSEDFENAVWSKSFSTIEANATIAPDNTNTGDKLILSSTMTPTSTRSVYQSVSITGVNTITIYAKAAEFSALRLSILTAANTTLTGPTFNLSNGSYDALVSAISANISSVGGGWYRCTATFDFLTGVTTARTYIASTQATGDGTSGIYIWGAQLEAGAFPTSYIPTTSATVTRAADNAVMTGTNFSSWYNQSEGTIYAAVSFTNTSSFNTVYSITDGTTSNVIRTIQWNNGTDRPLIITTLGVTQISAVSTGQIGSAKYAAAFKLNDANYAKNGVLGVDDTSVTLPTVNQLSFGSTAGSAFYLNGHIQSIKYYPTRLPNGTLQGLTA